MKTSSLHHRFQLVLGLITGIGLHTAVADPILDLRTRSWYGSTFPNSVNAMAAESNRLHVVTGPQGLSIIDISNPWLPSRKGGVDTDGDARDVTVAQGFAYIADDRNGLVIVDVRDGDHPVIRSRYPTTGSAWSVAFLNSTVFVADSVRGLLAIDVRDPDHPVLAHQFSTPQPIQDLAVQGDLVLAATGLDGLRAFRFPASGTPSEAWHLPDPTPFPSASNRGITHVAAGPGWAAFSLPTSSDIRILDLTSNDGPRLSVHLLTNSGVKSLEGAGDDLLIADNLFTTWKFRITGRQASYSHTLDDRDLGGPVSAAATASFGNYVFQFDSNGLLFTSDTAPNPVVTRPVMGRLGAARVVANDTHAFVTRWDTGLQIFDLIAPNQSEPIARLPFLGSPTDIAVDQGYAYIVDGGNQLRIVDVRNPVAPVELPPVLITPVIPDTDPYVPLLRIEVAHGLAYVSTWSKGLFILDVSDPGSVKTISQLFNKTDIKDVALNGTVAMLVYPNRAAFVDLTSPRSPIALGEFSLNGVGGNSVIEKDRAYVTDALYGLYILDISNPRSPRMVGSYRPYQATADVAVRDGWVSIIHSGGLEIINAHNPARPLFVGLFSSHDPSGFSSVFMNSDCVLAGDPNWGLFALHTFPGLRSVLRVQNAVTNLPCTIEWSPTLDASASWSPFVTRTNPPASFQIIDAAPADPSRFYRVIQRMGP